MVNSCSWNFEFSLSFGLVVIVRLPRIFSVNESAVAAVYPRARVIASYFKLYARSQFIARVVNRINYLFLNRRIFNERTSNEYRAKKKTRT